MRRIRKFNLPRAQPPACTRTPSLAPSKQTRRRPFPPILLPPVHPSIRLIPRTPVLAQQLPPPPPSAGTPAAHLALAPSARPSMAAAP
eukprot:3018772-Rhodomonas_salina.3